MKTSYEFIYEKHDGAPTIDRVEMVEKASLKMYRPIWTVLNGALVLVNLFGQFYFCFLRPRKGCMIGFSRLTAADRIEAQILFKQEREAYSHGDQFC